MCFKHSLSLLNNMVMEYLGKLEIHTSVKGGHTVALQMNDIQFELPQICTGKQMVKISIELLLK